jgi:5-methylcytosine-specific restriction enzyme subunit McrC
VTAAADRIGDGATWRSEAGIPVRNLWLLLVYASDLARFLDKADVKAEDDAEIADVLAKLLVEVVERRLRRSLSRAYIPRNAVLTRVRGRIDWLRTETGMLLQRGSVACRFEDHSHDTARNRMVRAALEAMHARLRNRSLADKCAGLARVLRQSGVSAGRPSRAEMSRDQIARHEDDDRLMVKVAELALDLVLPGEGAGEDRASRLDRDERLLRRIFERAVAGLYKHELHGRDGWRIWPQKALHWQAELPSRSISALLPGMAADIVLQHGNERRMVLDTKFTGILTARPHGGEALKSAHIYQLYAYLRSQAGQGDALADTAEGILLHPSIERHVDEAVTIQGHRFRFVTVDLSAPAKDLRRAILAIVLQNEGMTSLAAAPADATFHGSAPTG